MLAEDVLLSWISVSTFPLSCAVSSLGEAGAGQEALRAVSEVGPQGSRDQRQLQHAAAQTGPA